MSRLTKIVLGVLVLLIVTFANPLAGNVLGFCPLSEGPKAVSIDAVVAIIDIAAASLVYSGLRS
jgi:hypothetical protein